MPAYITTFKVTGRFSFPVDMLRYDGAYPHSTEDGVKLSEAIQLRQREPVTIELSAAHFVKSWEPTVARWKSFGWDVLPEWRTRKV